MATRPAVSSVVIGRLPELETDIAKVQVVQRVRDTQPYDAGAFHHGQEDPRWLVVHPHVNDTSLTERLLLMSASERWGKPRLFMRQVDADTLAATSKPVELAPRWSGAPYRQKNWMYLPLFGIDGWRTLFGVPDFMDAIVFVYQLLPLDLVYADTHTGYTLPVKQTDTLRVESSQSAVIEYRGSSAFIQLNHNICQTTIEWDCLRTGELMAWLGIVHSVDKHPVSTGDLNIMIYYNYFVRLALTKDGQRRNVRVSDMSRPWSLPSSVGLDANRINYPTSVERQSDED